MPRMLVVYQHLPHYRQDVFRALEDTPGWNVTFAAGTSTRDPGIAVMAHSGLMDARLLNNLWIGPFLWQRGLLRILLEPWDHVVFLGDWGYLSTWIGASLCRLRAVPVAFWTIGWHRREGGLRRPVRLAFYHLADQLLLYGTDAQRIGEEFGYPPERMTVIHNSSSDPPAHLEEGAQAIAKIKRALGEIEAPAVGAVIRLAPRKRLGDLVCAVADLNLTLDRPISIVLAGNGPDAKQLRSLADASGVPLHLVGPIYGQRALKLFYERCLVTVVPSLAGLTTLQSLKYGRPVITHDDPECQVPEYEAIRPGSTGDLYSRGDLRDMGRLIRMWIDEVTARPSEVAAACRQALEAGWTPRASARLIISALENPPPRKRILPNARRRDNGAEVSP